MKNLFLVVFLMITIKVAGQNHFVGVYGGSSISRYTRDALFPSEPRAGFGLGVTYDYMLKNWLSIGTGVSYSQQGFIYYLRYASQIQPDRGFSGETHSTHNNYDYLSIPIKANFNVGRKFFGFGNIGILPSMLIKAERKSPDFDQDGNYLGQRSSNIKNTVSNFDFSILSEAGLGYKFKERVWVHFSVLYQRSLMNIDFYAGSKLHTTTVCIGMKYALKGK